MEAKPAVDMGTNVAQKPGPAYLKPKQSKNSTEEAGTFFCSPRSGSRAKPNELLEPYAGKLARTVRWERSGNPSGAGLRPNVLGIELLNYYNQSIDCGTEIVIYSENQSINSS